MNRGPVGGVAALVDSAPRSWEPCHRAVSEGRKQPSIQGSPAHGMGCVILGDHSNSRPLRDDHDLSAVHARIPGHIGCDRRSDRVRSRSGAVHRAIGSRSRALLVVRDRSPTDRPCAPQTLGVERLPRSVLTGYPVHIASCCSTCCRATDYATLSTLPSSQVSARFSSCHRSWIMVRAYLLPPVHQRSPQRQRRCGWRPTAPASWR